MKTNLKNERADLKRKVLNKLIPYFPEKEIEHMTGIPSSSISYYRRTDKITTFSQERKNKLNEMMRNIKEAEESDQEYAKELVTEILEENGISRD